MDQFFQYLLAFLSALCTGWIAETWLKKLRAERARKARLEYFKRRSPPKQG